MTTLDGGSAGYRRSELVGSSSRHVLSCPLGRPRAWSQERIRRLFISCQATTFENMPQVVDGLLLASIQPASDQVDRGETGSHSINIFPINRRLLSLDDNLWHDVKANDNRRGH